MKLRFDLASESIDDRSFTEDEYLRELSFHHIELSKGESAATVYKRQGPSVTGRPRSGVFRDFFEYGVHPVRVVVHEIPLSVPFLVSYLSAYQLALEITNQKQRPEAVKKKKYPEEEAISERFVVTPSGHLRNPPTLDATFELVELLRKRKRYIAWTPALQNLMSAFNFFIFLGGFQKMKPGFLIPSRRQAEEELAPLISRKVAEKEISQRTLKDPSHWGSYDPKSARSSDIASLVGELMTDIPYTSSMRQIIEWYKEAFVLSQYGSIMENVINHPERIIATVKLRTSLVSAANAAQH